MAPRAAPAAGAAGCARRRPERLNRRPGWRAWPRPGDADSRLTVAELGFGQSDSAPERVSPADSDPAAAARARAWMPDAECTTCATAQNAVMCTSSVYWCSIP